VRVDLLKPLDAVLYREVVSRAIAEDLRQGDITTESTVMAGQRARGELRTKQSCVLAGLDIAVEVFRQLDPDAVVSSSKTDSDACKPGDVTIGIEGLAGALLTGERSALNFLQWLSGIATQARRYVTAAAGRTTILDTRKTTPTMRLLEKYAVRAGGAVNHRLTLDDALLIKDNHVRLAGSISDAVARVRERHLDVPVEIETQSLLEVDEALDVGVDVVLLDNFGLDDLSDAIGKCRGRAKTEVSGGVTLAQIDAIAALRPTYISVGALTHSAPSIDMSFKMMPAS